MTRTGFEKFLKEINSNLCLTTDCQLRPVEILFADDANKISKTVFDLITGTWHEGDNYLSLNEHDELNNLLIGSGAFFKGTHLFEESDSKDSINDNPFKDYTDHLAEVLNKKNTAYSDSFTESVDKFGLTVIPIRLSDKLNRICELVKNGELKENDASLANTLLDIAGYSILGLKYLKEHEYEK